MVFKFPDELAGSRRLPKWLLGIRLFRRALELAIEEVDAEPAADFQLRAEIHEIAPWMAQEGGGMAQEGEAEVELKPPANLRSEAKFLGVDLQRMAQEGATPEEESSSADQDTDERIADLLDLVSSARELLLNLKNENNSQRAWLDLLLAENSRLSTRLTESEGLVANQHSQIAHLRMKLRTAETRRMRLAVALDEANNRLRLRSAHAAKEHQRHALDHPHTKLKDRSSEVLLAGTITL
jgi:hypothetical protein